MLTRIFYELAEFDVFWKVFSEIPRGISFSLDLTFRSDFSLVFFFSLGGIDHYDFAFDINQYCDTTHIIIT